MKIVIYSGLMLLLVFSSFAQKFSISGKIQNQKGEALSFATVMVYKSDSITLKTQKYADEFGAFNVSIDTLGKYFIKISYTSYLDWTTTILLDRDKFVLDPINLQLDIRALSEVVITAKKEFIVKKLDRIVMNVKNNAAATGKSTIDLFKIAPGVFVNNGNISINGVSGARVMVNGKMLALGGNDLLNYLQNLKSEEIESIEIIPHPPAEFDASGSGGILNIILKREYKSGLYGSVGFDYSVGINGYPKYNPSASINYKKNKFGFSARYSYLKERAFSKIEQSRLLNDREQYSSVASSVFLNTSNNFRIDANYDLNRKQSIGLSYSKQWSTGNDPIESLTTIEFTDKTKSSYSRGNFPNRFKSNYSNLGFNYNFLLDSLGSKITFIGDYTGFKRDANSLSNSLTYASNGTKISDTSFVFYFPNNSNILTGDASYSKALMNGLKFQAGTKFSVTEVLNNNSYSILLKDIWVSNPSLVFNYKYNESIYAGYLNFSGEYKKINFNAGLRAEQTNVTGGLISDSQDTTITRNYINFFPSLYLMKKLDSSGNNTISFSYSKRVVRPSYSELNPFRYFIDNYSIEEGNPYLNPHFTNSLELAYSLKSKYTFTLGYSNTRDLISTVISTMPNSSLMTVSPRNVGINTVYSISLFAQNKIADWWSSSSNLLLSRSSSSAPAFKIKQYTFLIQSEQEIQLTKRLNLNVNIFYTPRLLEGNIVTNRISSIDAGLKMKFFKNKLQGKLAISDIFYMNNFKGKSFYNNSLLHISQRSQSRMVSLSLTYDFNLGKIFEATELLKSNEEQKERLF